MVGLLRGVNPVIRVALMFIVTFPLLLSLDWLSATVSLALTLVMAPLCGVGYGRLARAAWPLLLIAPLSGLSMLLYGRPGGQSYFQFWLINITDNSLGLAGAIMLRVLAVALPVIVLARDIDPTELGDGLAQVLRLPARFVIGAVAGVRMLILFREDWDSMSRARRARGLGDAGRLRATVSKSFSLLVLALRRGGKLATAMEARGFGRAAPSSPDGKRTWARPSRLRARDWWALLAGVVLAAVPAATAVAFDTWRWFGL